MEEEKATLGRGRGRGHRQDTELRPASSSTSGKREADESHSSGNGNGNGNGTGKKRGTTREYAMLPVYNTRPETAQTKKGTSGRPVQLSANYFKLLQRPTFKFVMYRVDWKPEFDLIILRKVFLSKQREFLGGYLFDGQNMIYLTHELALDEYKFDCESREGAHYEMTIKKAGVVHATSGMISQILNLILRRAMEGLEMELVGRNLYDPKAKVALNDYKVDLWPGYITSIRQHEEHVLICSEVSHKVMRQDSIYEILVDLKRNSAGNWQEDFRKEMLGKIVLTGYNNRTYRVDDIDFASTPSSTFKGKNDRDVSYVEYYQERYRVEIRDRKQPMLVSSPKARDVRGGRTEMIFLVPELCRATGLTDKQRANFQMMRAMADHTQMDPERRKTRLLEMVRRINEAPRSVQQLSGFNVGIDRNLIQFEGRAMKQEQILYGQDKSAMNDDRVDWTNSMKTNDMYTTVPLKRWVYIYPKRCERESEEFIVALKRVAQGMHYEMADPKTVVLSDDRLDTYVREVKKAVTMDPKMIMVVLPNNAADRYAAIKNVTCVQAAIPTQAVVSRTLMPKKGGVMSIATKVLIQINCKLGGAAWMINFPLQGTMTIGYDVTHDTRDRSKSYGAFVASMDLKEAVKYFSAVQPHVNGEEMSNNISMNLVKALKAFKNQHGRLPERIFFYRDGVGDGDIEYVHSKEVKVIDNKLKEIYHKVGGGVIPKLSFIVVNKRLNTRIFAVQGNRYSNPVSGTVVDTTITLPERYDFFLVSQSVRQGTVAPTSYNVIHDTNGLPPDKMQMLTYKQTHLYYNWSGCTRVPAVVQYAHKLAFLVGQFLHQSPSQEFNNTLYFL